MRLSGSTSPISPPLAKKDAKRDDDYCTLYNYKNISYRNNNIDNSFANSKYFEPFQIFEKLFGIIKRIHYAKIINKKLNDEQRENTILILAEFRDAFNKEYSELLGVKIILLISSHKLNKFYQDKHQRFPTITGFGR